MKWLDMTDVFTPEGFEAIQTGQLLVFDRFDERVRYKVMRKTKDKIFAKEVNAYLQKELEIHEHCDVDLTADPPFCNTHLRPIGESYDQA